jgi:ABC-type transporter Mla subunit MlaD
MKTWLGKIRVWELALLLLCGFGSYFLWNATQDANRITDKAVVTLDHTNQTLTKADGTLDTLNTTIGQVGGSLKQVTKDIDGVSTGINMVLAKLLDPCRPIKGHIYTVDEDKPCGTLADFARTLHTIRGFAGTLEFAGRHLDTSLTTYDKQEADLSKNTNDTLSSLNSTINFARYLMESHQVFLDNLQRLAGNGADAMGNVKDITGDIRVQTKALNAPKTKTQKFLQWLPPLVRLGITAGCATMGPC